MCQVFFKIGPFTVYTYGFFVALGFLAGTYISVLSGKRAGIDKEKMIDLNVTVFVAGIIGARLLYILTSLKYYLENPLSMFKIWEGGIVFYGGFILGIGAFLWFTKKNKLSVWKTADVIAPGIIIAQAIGRIGCFLNGCCYGKQNNSIGIVFKSLGDSIPRMPVQLFEALGSFIIFVILLNMKKKFNGQIFLFYVFLYGSFRFLMEYLRGDDRGPVIFSVFSVSQLISIILITAGVIIYKKLKTSEN